MGSILLAGLIIVLSIAAGFMLGTANMISYLKIDHPEVYMLLRLKLTKIRDDKKKLKEEDAND